jgi:hypothetical protein
VSLNSAGDVPAISVPWEKGSSLGEAQIAIGLKCPLAFIIGFPNKSTHCMVDASRAVARGKQCVVQALLELA